MSKTINLDELAECVRDVLNMIPERKKELSMREQQILIHEARYIFYLFAYQDGYSIAEISKNLKKSRSTIYNLRKTIRSTSPVILHSHIAAVATRLGKATPKTIFED